MYPRIEDAGHYSPFHTIPFPVDELDDRHGRHRVHANGQEDGPGEAEGPHPIDKRRVHQAPRDLAKLLTE